MRTWLLAAFTVLVFAQPKIENAKLQTRAVNGSLDATVAAS